MKEYVRGAKSTIKREEKRIEELKQMIITLEPKILDIEKQLEVKQMNLYAHSNDEGAEFPLFSRQCKNKAEAKKAILMNPWAFRVSRITFKGKQYTIKEVYKW